MLRRALLRSGLVLPVMIRAADAQPASRASSFFRQTADSMTAVINGNQTLAEKRRLLTQIVDSSVNVDDVARFCLGRYWQTATPDQKARYVSAFHATLVMNIEAKLGDYRGVKITINRERAQDGQAILTTTVERPNHPPATVEWTIEQPAAAPKIIDVIAEGTSMRVTQRQDYTSFLSQNNHKVEALIAAMKQKSGG